MTSELEARASPGQLLRLVRCGLAWIGTQTDVTSHGRWSDAPTFMEKMATSSMRLWRNGPSLDDGHHGIDGQRSWS